MKKLSQLKDYLYPILIAIYPVLALQQANISYVNASVIMRALGLTLLFSSLVWLLLRWVLKDWHKAGILTASAFLLFFAYGHVFLWGLDQPFGPLRHSQITISFVLIMTILAFFIIRKKNAAPIERFLNITSLVLLTFIVVQSAVYAFQVWKAAAIASRNTQKEVISGSTEDLPDIYLIVLDAHTRSDILLEKYDFDNSEFITGLESMGFYVADCSQSNYPGTNFSLISMMNLDYLYNLFDEIQVIPALKNSVVSETLREQGYKVVAFENRASGHYDLLEDVHLSRNQTVLANFDLGGGINEFESMLIETSFLRIFVDMPQLLPNFIAGDVKDAEFYEHYLQTFFILEELKNLPATPGPKLVMAHILTPHDPYIFAPDGSYQPSGAKGAIVGYRNNVTFIDNFLPDTIEAIINNSDRPPIIIIQGDHGPTGDKIHPEERMSILNAYYVPERAKENLYPTITPINSFRVILNEVFNTQYPLIEDHSYYIWNTNQMLDQKNEVINTCQP
jgi:uncharacterized membrane protein YozB (DUF420 family)